jgi:hypothetical protein
MSDAVFSSLITGVLALIGVVVSNLLSSKKTEQTIAVNQAVTDTKIVELTREVREHNNFALRMPVLEQRLKTLEQKVEALESYHKQPVNPAN